MLGVQRGRIGVVGVGVIGVRAGWGGVIYFFLFIYLYSHIFLLFYLQLMKINSALSGGYTDGVVVGVERLKGLGVIGSGVVGFGGNSLGDLFIYLLWPYIFTCISSTAEDQ